ncbi:MAG TPA: ABC transporter permease [Bryobacteraceae bacterium]|jgi:predicted permease|nr:ABC transporter permease [Bryobacteraceae bacterium]
MKAGPSWKRFRLRLRYWLDRHSRQRLLWEEMEFHIESMTQDFAAEGMPEEEARIAARRRFGNMTRTSEDVRFTWIAHWISDLAQDLRYALRGMRRDAGFTTFVILIAGLGIGASSTVFSVVNAVLLRPLPFHYPDRLVWIANQEWGIQVSHFLDLRERNKSLSDLAGFGGIGVGEIELAGTAGRERLTSSRVTQNFFPLLGVQPMIGRSFTADECQQKDSNPPAVLLSHGFWLRRFASDPAMVGRPLILNNKPVMVVGVLPASFDFASIFAPGTPVDVFIPWPLTAETSAYGNTTQGIGRLRPGGTVQSAQAEFSVLGKQLDSEHPIPERNPVTPRVSPLTQHVSGRVRPALVVLACAVGVVMLIVCANLSNLQLARLGTRQTEMAMRTALGAGRLRLLRQMLTESVALSCCGAAFGLILAVAGTRAITHLDTFNIPLLASVRLDADALGFTLVAAVLTGVLFGLLPALRVPSLVVGEALKDGSRGSRGGQKHAWVRNALVVSEVAFACTLLVGAGLLMRSFLGVLDVNLGFQPERAAAMRVDPSFRFSGPARQNSYIDEVLQRTRSLAGVRAAGLTDVLPFGGDRSWSVSVKGRFYEKNRHPEPYIRVVTDGYFEAAGIPLRAGRLFTEGDRAASQPVVIINETMARTAFPGENPLGQTITTYRRDKVLGVVVGVVADVRHSALEEASGPEMYQGMRQTDDYSDMNLVVRTVIPPDQLAPTVRAALRRIDPNLPVSEFRPLQDLVAKAVSPRRFLVLLLTGFAGFALVLASLGIYAVISYSVNQRVQEIGIRMALGASATDLQNHILLGTLGLAALGLALGLAASRAFTGALESLLFGVTPGDPVTFIGIGALLIVVAALAAYLPARRASRIDPMVALRSN